MQSGYTERDVATSLLNSLSGSFQTAPLFFLNPQNGINYNLVAKTRAVPDPVAAGPGEHADRRGRRSAAGRFWPTSPRSPARPAWR